MPTTGNLSQTDALAPPPLPPSSQVEVETADKVMNNGAEMPSQYWGGKGGAIAFEADKVLRGWMAGKYLGEQKQREKAAQTMGSMQALVDSAGQAYRAAVESGDKGQIQKAYNALQLAYDNHTAAMEKYVIPEDLDGGKKKGVGGKVKAGMKAMFSPQHPQFFPAAAIQIRKQMTSPSKDGDPSKTGLAGLYGPSKAEQQQSEVADMQIQSMKREKENNDRWEKVALAPDDKLSKEDKQFKEFYEYTKFGRTKTDRIKDELLEKVVGNKELNDQERQLAENFGILKPKVASTQLRTVQDPKTGQPVTQLVSIGPDGKLVGTANLPGKDWVPPNQAQLAGQVIQTEYGALRSIAKKTHPDWDDKTANQWALTNVVTRYTGQPDWGTRNQQVDVMNRAIQAVMQKHKHVLQGQTTYDPVIGDFVVAGDDGRYVWRGSLGPPDKKGLWDRVKSSTGIGTPSADTYSGKTPDQLRTEENNLRAELRAELKHQNPKISDTEIDSLIPSSISAGAQGMNPPPGRPGMDPTPRAATGGTGGSGQTGNYSVKLPSGETVTQSMTKEHAEYLKAQGLAVTLMGTGPDQIPNNLP